MRLKNINWFMVACFSLVAVMVLPIIYRINTTQITVRDVSERICSKDTTEKRSKFILSCIKGANPMSDEEPEDWIDMCRIISEKTFCKYETYRITEECRNPAGCRITSRVKVNL